MAFHCPARGVRHQPCERVDLLVAGCSDVCRELRSRADAELAIDLREVPRDRVRAEAELRGDVAVPTAGDDELDDSPLGLGELSRRTAAPADPPQLGACLRLPEARPESREAPGGELERLARLALVLRAPLHGAEREQRPRELERIRTLRRR